MSELSARQSDKKGEARETVKDSDKIDEELTIDELLPELRKVIDRYEEAGEDAARRFVLNLPGVGELYAAFKDAQETYDTFVENLEPELKASLLLLQLLNSKLEVDKDKGKEGVTIPQGTVEALNDLMSQRLSKESQKHLKAIDDKMAEFKSLHTALERKVRSDTASKVRSLQKFNKEAAAATNERVNELQKKVDAAAERTNQKLSEQRPQVASAAGGRKKRTRKAKRRTRRPLAKSKVIKRSTRRIGKHSKRA